MGGSLQKRESAFEKAVGTHRRAQERIDKATTTRDKAFLRALAAADKEGLGVWATARALNTSVLLVIEHRLIARFED